VSTWVFTIARNLRVDLAGKASRANAEIGAKRELPMRLEASVEEMALASEWDARVRSVMATLS
jgi:DNA-directed RNA polymerase specialized sigma24 family protein